MSAVNGQGEQKQWGVTLPLSTALPTEKDLTLNNQLTEELRQRGNYETPENTDKRKRVLGHLQKVTETFVKDVARKKNLPPAVVDHAGGFVATFGSYRLGVYGPGSSAIPLQPCLWDLMHHFRF